MDAFEEAKINEDREPILEARARDAARAAIKARIDEVRRLPINSPFAELDEGLILEICKREGLVDAPEWSDVQRRIALTIVYDDRVRAETPPPPPAPETFHSMPRAVPLPPPKVPRPAAPKPKSVDDLPASANGCYVVTKGGKCFINGGQQFLSPGKVLTTSYGRDALQAILEFGLEIEPQVPVDAFPEPEVMPTWTVEVGDAASASSFVQIQVAVPAGIDPAELANWARQVLGAAVTPEEPSMLRQIEAELAAEEARAAAAREVEDRARAEEEAAEARAAAILAAAADADIEAKALKDLEADIKEAEAEILSEEADAEDQAARSRANAETDPQTPRGKRGRKA